MARKITFIPAKQTQIEGNLASQIKKIRMAAYCRVSTNHEDQQLARKPSVFIQIISVMIQNLNSKYLC